jgi:hypothetical protein
MTEQYHTQTSRHQGWKETLGRARRRALWVSGGAVALSWVAAALLLLAAATWATAKGAGPWVGTAAAGVLAAGAVAALVVVALRARRLTDGAVAQALEDALPQAEGLVSALEFSRRLDDPTYPYSTELARAHVRQVEERLRGLDVSQAFDRRPLLVPARGAAGTAAIFLLAVALWPGAFGSLLGRSAAPQQAQRRATPITGDVSLTYVYPRYTGLPQKTVEGTAGEITALRGTEVRIETRADREVARAFLEVGEAALPLEVEGGRILRGSLLLQASGSYAFRFEDARGKVLAQGPPIPITVEEDAAPAVRIDAPIEELVVTERDTVEVQYEATDDFGVSRLELVFKVGPSEEERQAVASFAEARRRAAGTYAWELAPLGLRPGETVTYFLRARDDDGVSGAKWGESRTQVLKVYSAAEHRRELLARAEEAWEQMIVALGDRIPPREGPKKVTGEARIDAGRQADTQVQVAVGLLHDVAAEFGKDEAAPAELFAAVQNLAKGLGRKAQHTRSTRGRAAGVRTGREAFLRQLDEAEGDEQVELERGVLYLESLLDRQRLFEIEELSRELSDCRQELTRLIESFQEAPTDEARRAVLRELGRLRQRIEEMMQRMAQLSRGIQDEHLNLEAQKALAKEKDLFSQLDEVEQKVQDGDLEGALAEMQKLAMQMDELTQAMGGAMDSQLENDPALQQLAEDLEAFDTELAELERRQQQLVDETERLRQQQAQRLQQRLASTGKDLVEELVAKVRGVRERLRGIPENELPRMSADDHRAVAERLDNLEQALLARDLDAALESAVASLGFGTSLELGLEREASYAQRFGIGSPEELDAWLGEVRRSMPQVREVKDTLEQMLSDPAEGMSQQQRQRLDSLAQEQSELGEKMEALRDQAEAIGEQAPIFDDGSMQTMEEARQSMQDAAGKLRQRQPGGALASERRAQEGLQTLRQGLEQAKQQAQGNRGGQGFPLPLGGGGRRGGSGGGFDGRERVEIPDADSFEAPEAYRKEILDAMKKKAPEEFEEPVKDYYQEIVK